MKLSKANPPLLMQLSNGARIVALHMPHLRSASVRLYIQTGSQSEREGEHGWAHLLEHLGFAGAPEITRDDLADTIEGAGVSTNASTDYDVTMYTLDGPGGAVAAVLPTFLHAVAHASVPHLELGREIPIVCREIEQNLDSPINVAWDHLFGKLYEGTPRAHPIAGDAEQVRAASPDALLEFKHKNYTGPRTVLALAGDLSSLDTRNLLRQAEAAIGAWPRNIPENPPGGVFRHVKLPATHNPVSKFDQAYVFVAQPDWTVKKLERVPAVRIANAVAGQGMSSLLFRRIRNELGLAYATGSFLYVERNAGLLCAYAIAAPDMAELAAREIQKTIQLGAERMAPGLFASGQQKVLGPLLTAQDSAGRVAGRLAFTTADLGSPSSLDDLLEVASEVTMEQTQEQLQDWAMAGKFTQIMLPEKDTEK